MQPLSEPDQMTVPVDAEIVPNPADIQCDGRSGRAVLTGTFRCDAQPLYVDIDGDNGRYQIFAYEASHPLALPNNSHPCGTVEESNGQRVNFQAPDEPTEACSKPGVRPWHSVSWEDAKRACVSSSGGACVLAMNFCEPVAGRIAVLFPMEVFFERARVMFEIVFEMLTVN